MLRCRRCWRPRHRGQAGACRSDERSPDRLPGQSAHPQWLWCDSFESDTAINSNYFDVDRASGRMTLSTDSPFDGSHSLQMQYVPGQSDSGSLKLSLGATPVAPTRYTSQKFDEV